MICRTKFEYGDKRIEFNEEMLFLDPVDNVHDLTEWEDRLEDSYAVYTIENKLGLLKKNPLIKYQWALVTTKDISFITME